MGIPSFAIGRCVPARYIIVYRVKERMPAMLPPECRIDFCDRNLRNADQEELA